MAVEPPEVGPDEAELMENATGLVPEARAFVISTHQAAQHVGIVLRQIMQGEKRVEEFFYLITRPYDEAKKKVLERKKALLQPIEDAKRLYKAKLGVWHIEEQRRQNAEIAVARKAEDERRQAEAAALAADGAVEEAEDVLAAPPPPSTSALAIPKVEGTYTQTRYSCMVNNMPKLVAHVAAHPEMIALLQPHMPSLNALAVAMKDAFQMPGCELIKQTTVSVRTG
mgnify:CR=1 FL=1